jgi:phosphoenolpyruvate carboxykinase (ATP)
VPTRAPRLPQRNGDRGQLHRKLILIGGTAYAGEMKKSVFGILNYLLPVKGVMPMHCSANIGPDGETAVFFGLSGTGKTTLSADASRTLIGDDEHGWSDTAVFNFEGGCYAKMIRLSAEAGNLRHHQALRHGAGKRGDRSRHARSTSTTIRWPKTAAVPTRSTSFRTRRKKTSARAANLIFLTADAYGVLPPIALTRIRRCITSCRATPRAWRAPKSA